MKRVIPYLVVFMLLTTSSFSQDLIAKIPQNASAVLTYSSASMTQKVPVNKFESYLFLKKKIHKELGVDEKVSFGEMGIDLQQNAYQYFTYSDTSSSFVTLLPIKDVTKFEKFIQIKNKHHAPIESKGGFKVYNLSNRRFLAWNNKVATLVDITYTNYYRYHSYSDISYATDSTAPTVVMDTTVAVDSLKMSVDSTVSQNDKAKVMVDSVKISSIQEEGNIVEAPKADSTVIMDAPMSTTETQAMIEARKAREEEERREELKDDSTRKKLADSVLFTTYDSTIQSISTVSAFNQLSDKNADISIWMDSKTLFERMYPFSFYESYSMYRYPYYHFMNQFRNFPGFAQCSNIYFEKDRIRLESKMLSGSDSAEKIYNSIYDSKQSPALANYIRSTDKAFISMSVNTEAIENFYYLVLKNIMRNTMRPDDEDAPMVDVFIDVLQVMIDEKGIADVVPGNAILSLHGLKSKKVSYISYDYDKEFNYKPITKTKTELTPDFTLAFETRNEKILKELEDLPAKMNKRKRYNYSKTGDYYTWVGDSSDVLDTVYFMVKDGKCLITTSLQDINGTTTQNASDAATRETILKDNYYGRFDMKSLLNSFSSEVEDADNKKLINSLQNNVGDITFESYLQDKTARSSMIINIKGNHKNSFEYLFEVIDSILKMDAPDGK